MQLSNIAKDLAQKSVVSRTLGGVVKAGQYADWAEEYKQAAQEHYASLETEKKADQSLLANTLIGGGLGAAAGGLGSYLTSSKKKRLKDALTYGLLGGLGGAGLGAAGTLLSDPDSARRFFGDNTPKKLTKVEEMRNSINATGLPANSPAGIAVKPIAGYGLGYGAGKAIEKAMGEKGKDLKKKILERFSPVSEKFEAIPGKEKVLMPREDAIPGRDAKIEATSLSPIKVKEDYVIRPEVKPKFKDIPEVKDIRTKSLYQKGTPGKRILIDSGSPEIRGSREVLKDLAGPSFKITDPGEHGPIGVNTRMLPTDIHGPTGIKSVGFEDKKMNLLESLASKILYKGKAKGSPTTGPATPRGKLLPKTLGALGAGLGLVDIATAQRTPGQMSAILNNNISKLINSDAVKSNPQLLARLVELKKETTPGLASYVPGLGRVFGGVSNQRANSILNELAQNFSE
jgi:hypothetical protein